MGSIFGKAEFREWLNANDLSDLIFLTRSGKIKEATGGKMSSNIIYLDKNERYPDTVALAEMLKEYFADIDTFNIKIKAKNNYFNVTDISIEIVPSGEDPTYKFYDPDISVISSSASRTSANHDVILVKGKVDGIEGPVDLFVFLVEPTQESLGLGKRRVSQEALVAMYINLFMYPERNSWSDLIELTGLDISTRNIMEETLGIVNDVDIISFPDADSDLYTYYLQGETIYNTLIVDGGILSSQYPDFNRYKWRAIYNDDFTNIVKNKGVEYIWGNSNNLTTRRDKYTTADIWLVMSDVYNKLSDYSFDDIDIKELVSDEPYKIPKIIGLSLKKDNTRRRGAVTEFVKDKDNIFQDDVPVPFIYKAPNFLSVKEENDISEFTLTTDVINWFTPYINLFENGSSNAIDEYDDLLIAATDIIEALTDAVTNTLRDKGWDGPIYVFRKYDKEEARHDAVSRARQYRNAIISKNNMALMLCRILSKLYRYTGEVRDWRERPDIRYFLAMFNFGSGNIDYESDTKDNITIPCFICSPNGKNQFGIHQISEWRKFNSMYTVNDTDKDMEVYVNPFVFTHDINNVPINYVDGVKKYTQVEFVGARNPVTPKDQS